MEDTLSLLVVMSVSSKEKRRGEKIIYVIIQHSFVAYDLSVHVC